MGSVRREPTPPGPVTDLFVRLDDLHSQAGRPSMREIARRAGRGSVSSSTIHNVFRGSRVPRWDFLEQIVRALGADTAMQAAFHALWDAAWRAEDEARASRDGLGGVIQHGERAGQQTERPARSARPGTVLRGAIGRPEGSPRRTQRIWSNEIPSRNPDFVGRAAELEKLSRILDTWEHHPHVQVISGMGGIGKTELATEYVHRNIDKYDIIWWIRAEHHDRVREALVSLARRLEPGQVGPDTSRGRAIEAVLGKLESEGGANWLLVYDNAANLLDLQRYLPGTRPGGHIIITTRELNWPTYTPSDRFEIAPFTEAEAVDFLRRRVPGLGPRDPRGRCLVQEDEARRIGDARRLAGELGYLPIAIIHAGAYLTETTRSVDEYLTRFANNAHQLLSEQPPADSDIQDFPAHVSGTWALSNELLTADAKHLFNLCAFFSPEPIAVRLFARQVADINDPPGLAEFLSDAHRLRAAASQLHRLSLVRYDGARDLIQVHRVVQAVTQGRLHKDHSDQFYAYRAAVDALLARSNPGNPDHGDGDPVYELSLQHLESDHRFLNTSNPALRDLIIDQVRRLHLRGAHDEAAQFGQHALRVWEERHGAGDLKALTMGVEVAVAMYMGGRVADSHELILRIRPRLQRYSEGDGFRASLQCESIYGADLRAHSQFRDALELDRAVLPKFEAAFGADHERTLSMRNNVALGCRRLGEFREALEMDLRTYEDRRRILGPHDPLTLHSHTSVARDRRGLGEYQESLEIAREVGAAFESIGTRESLNWLNACMGFAVALHKAGYYWEARQESEHVYERCRAYLGADHMYTLMAATNLINNRRAIGDLMEAEELARETIDLCQEPNSPADLLFAAQLHLASVLRSTEGGADHALWYDEQARTGLIRIYGMQHPFTLAASVNYAADLAAGGKLGEAIQVGEVTVANCRAILGDGHPDTLMAEANLSLDMAAAGDGTAAKRRAELVREYRQALTAEHPEVRRAERGERLTAEIEPLVQ